MITHNIGNCFGREIRKIIFNNTLLSGSMTLFSMVVLVYIKVLGMYFFISDVFICTNNVTVNGSTLSV